MLRYRILTSDNSEYTCGGKAYGLYLLNSIGMQIPETLIVPKGLNIPEYKQQIEEFIDNVNSQYANSLFAIRSSANNEDGVKNSWAGVYETKLSVSYDEVYEYILRMYCYTDTARKKAYSMFVNNTSNSEMSLVVQRMIEPKISGVCFTVNPINGNSDEIVIEVIEGIGEKLVGGMVTPQMYIIKGLGNCIYFEEGDFSSLRLLSDKIICDITNKIIYIKEKIYKEADIEFAIQDNDIYFLQIRPITKIYKP
jgi:pyruvate,water dikinase